MQNQMWLTSEVLKWPPKIESSTINIGKQWRRAYEIWSNADQILQKEDTDFHRIVAITTLKRSVEHRLRLLTDIYKFKKIPIRDKPSNILEILGYLDIIRPIMLKKLIDIRDAVEHQDASPPNRNDCLSFLDFVWYFLRSTDQLVRQLVNSFDLTHNEEDLDAPYGVTIIMSPENEWNPNITGCIQPDIISAESVDGWILLNVKRINTRAALLKEPGYGDILNGKEPDDIYFEGEIRGPAEQLKKVVLIYFEAV